MYAISKEDLYGVWVSFQTRLPGVAAVEVPYYQYSFTPDHRFSYSTRIGQKTTSDSREKTWDLENIESNNTVSTVITIDGKSCYKIASISKERMILILLESGMVYHLARGESNDATHAQTAGAVTGSGA